MDLQSPCESSDLSSVGSLSPPPPGDYPSPASSQDFNIGLASTQPISNKHCHEEDGLPPTKKRKIAEARPRTTQTLDLEYLNTGLASTQPISNKHSLEDDCLPPTKKRKIANAKPRTTQTLDLETPSSGLATDQKAQLALLLKVLRKKRKIVVIAGAGISVSAGVPDFRSSTGLFSTLRNEHKLKASGKHLFDASVYQTDSSTSSFHDMVRSLSKLVSNARPTAFHQMLATLASEGRLMRLYTQNVDGIDTSLPPLVTSVPLSMKGPWPRTIQLHGGLEKMVCSKCNHLSDFEAALFEGPLPPPCTACMETDKVRTDHAGKRSHGIGRLRPRIVLYNEHNPDEEAIGTVVSADLRTRPDAVIVVGTSMKIPGVKRIVREMCGVVRSRKDGLTVWVNHEPPPLGKEFEDCFDLVVKGACDEVASRADMRRWDDHSVDNVLCTTSEVERVKASQLVAIPLPPKTIFDPSMLTPAPSPRPKSSRPVSIKLKLSAPDPAKALSKKIAISKVSGSKPNPKHATKKVGASKPSIVSALSTKITTSFKIAKTAPLQSTPIKKTQNITINPNRLSLTGDEGLLLPMAPLSPQAARNNGPVASPTKPLFPNLSLVKPKASPGRLKRRSEEIVSPTGAIPSGMKGLLN
ncbi:hypothetical protein MMC07_000133 [Pseudocyphellaria aurata]|nr:hypothetical protein [Pseudocyphellaria aurata]